MMRSRGVGATTTALSGPIDVHMVTHHERARQGGRRLQSASGLTVGRRIGGFASP
jgi:two-component system, OmpR family, sensor histidine kinase KdpD